MKDATDPDKMSKKQRDNPYGPKLSKRTQVPSHLLDPVVAAARAARAADRRRKVTADSVQREMER